MKRSIALIAGLVLLDLAVKTAVLSATPFPLELWGPHRRIYPGFMRIAAVTGFFDIILVWNTGISFSFLSGDTQAMRWLLIAVSLAVTAVIFRFMGREETRLGRTGYAFVIAGALGNVVDRVRYGAVVDFLDFHAGSLHWPAFNVADMLICLGVALLLLPRGAGK
ncbi:MAG: signal peptidase II [Rickettsiales bacterium]|jgi:signal peptidase II|nr:signal peptidase II [Rickettsiales bacterium]